MTAPRREQQTSRRSSDACGCDRGGRGRDRRGPGRARCRRQLHVTDYASVEEFIGKRVIIVGAGVSAVQLLDEISQLTETVWMTRREPDWIEEEFDLASRSAAIAGVEARVREGLPPGSVISVTGTGWTPWARAAEARGVLVRHRRASVSRSTTSRR